MRIMNKSRGMCLLIAFFLLSTVLVHGLGVSPGKKTINFQPNTSIELEFNIINSEKNTFEASLSASGDFADIIFFENQTVMVHSDNYRTPFKVLLRFPSEMEPGIHRGRIEVNPILPGPADKMFVAYIAPQIPISVRVPYPFKYADVSLVVLRVDEGTPVPIFVEFDNMGSEDILRAGAEIELYDPDEELITSISTPEISVNKQALGKTRAQPSPILRRGLYRAVVKAYYDEFDKTIETNFTIGEPLVRIKELITRELTQDEVNKVLFKAYNEWNTELLINGFLEINQRQSEMPVFKLDKNEEKEVTGFFDTTGLVPGNYNMSITLIYADQVRTHTFLVTITKKIGVLPEKLRKLWPVLVILGVIIIIILIFLVFLIIKKRKLHRERNL